MNANCFNYSLCKTNNGEVLLSACGRNYKMVFNNIILIHGYESYITFFKNVENCHYSVKEESDKDKRDIVFATLSSSMVFCFSVSEIAELYYLMQSALIEAKIYV